MALQKQINICTSLLYVIVWLVVGTFANTAQMKHTKYSIFEFISANLKKKDIENKSILTNLSETTIVLKIAII